SKAIPSPSPPRRSQIPKRPVTPGNPIRWPRFSTELACLRHHSAPTNGQGSPRTPSPSSRACSFRWNFFINPTMKLCRFRTREDEIHIGLVAGADTLLDLTPAGITRLQPLLESEDPAAQLQRIAQGNLPRLGLSNVQLCAPVE